MDIEIQKKRELERLKGIMAGNKVESKPGALREEINAELKRIIAEKKKEEKG